MITFPSSPRPRSMTWRLVQPSQVNISEWTGARQVLASGRGWWECQLELPPIVGTSDARPWRSFVALSLGSTQTFQIHVDTAAQSAVVGFTARVNGGGQAGSSLVTDGWPLSSTVLQAGAFLTIGDQLVQLTGDVTSNGSGQATVSFTPAIRVSPADNAVIEYLNPYCLMYLVEEPSVNIAPGRVHTLSFNLREAF